MTMINPRLMVIFLLLQSALCLIQDGHPWLPNFDDDRYFQNSGLDVRIMRHRAPYTADNYCKILFRRWVKKYVRRTWPHSSVVTSCTAQADPDGKSVVLFYCCDRRPKTLRGRDDNEHSSLWTGPFAMTCPEDLQLEIYATETAYSWETGWISAPIDHKKARCVPRWLGAVKFEPDILMSGITWTKALKWNSNDKAAQVIPVNFEVMEGWYNPAEQASLLAQALSQVEVSTLAHARVDPTRPEDVASTSASVNEANEYLEFRIQRMITTEERMASYEFTSSGTSSDGTDWDSDVVTYDE